VTTRISKPSTGGGATSHAELTGVTPDQHHAKVHGIASSDHTGQLSHTALSDIGTYTHAQIDAFINGGDPPSSTPTFEDPDTGKIYVIKVTVIDGYPTIYPEETAELPLDTPTFQDPDTLTNYILKVTVIDGYPTIYPEAV
jgi:hypothetical protein